jgi:hypothetical protein
MSTSVPVGSTLTRIYYTVPGLYSVGTERATLDDAVHEARWQKDEGWRKNEDGVRVWIDERWVMTRPGEQGGTTDLMVDRTEFYPTETREQWLTRTR